MRNYRFFKALKIAAFVILASLVFGFVIMHLWNWLIPAIFGLHRITFWQGLGLFVFSKILFGGFHRGHGGRRHWKQHMQERWEKMSPEEREKFRAGMRGRRGCRFNSPEQFLSERDRMQRENQPRAEGV
jgi:hypothetical protein